MQQCDMTPKPLILAIGSVKRQCHVVCPLLATQMLMLYKYVWAKLLSLRLIGSRESNL
jgi:hypothetical protein